MTPPAENIPAGQLVHCLVADEYAMPAAHVTNASMVTHVPERCHIWNVEDPLTPTATHIAFAVVAVVPIDESIAAGARSVTEDCVAAVTDWVEPAAQAKSTLAMGALETPEASVGVGSAL